MRYGVTKQEIAVEEREVAEGVMLYKRDRSRLWQARIRRVTGKWISISTRTDDIEVAKEFALQRYREMKDAQARGDVDIVRGHKDFSKVIRELLVDYVSVLYNTGMRPGVESLNLKWNQIKRIAVFRDGVDAEGDSPSTLKFAVVGKKKRPRTLVCRDIDGNVSGPLKAIRPRFEELKDLSEDVLFKQDEYVFRTREGRVPNHQRLTKSFKLLLRWLGIEKDAHGNTRTLYSLRHTYATSGLVQDMIMETLAAQMGTSRPMIERHYSKLRPEMKVVELSGWRERAKTSAAPAIDMSNVVKLLTEQNQMLIQRIEEITRESRVIQT